MIRSINESFGYHGYSETDGTYDTLIDSEHYPAQNEDLIGKAVALRFFAKETQINYPRFRFPSQVLKNNKYGIDFSQNIKVEEYDKVLPFLILRYDLEAPNRVIAISVLGHIICTTTDIFEAALTYADTDYCEAAYKYIENYSEEYIFEVYKGTKVEELELLTNYGSETVFTVPPQYENLLGRSVWIEYQNDLTKDISTNIGPKQNKFEFTEEMKRNLIKGDNNLNVVPDVQLQSYPYYFNIHSDSLVDNPRRALSTGYIIRCDNLATIVYCNINGEHRYIMADEGRFFYDTRKINTYYLSIQTDMINKHGSILDFILNH